MLGQDLRYALRSFRKSPAFTAAAVATLALGLASATAIFSLVDAVLVRRLPFPEPDRILTIWQVDARRGSEREEVMASTFLDWQERQGVFSPLAAMEPYGFDLLGHGEPETFPSSLVTKELFPLLGARALHGRLFTPEEFAPGRDHVVVLSHALWASRFGSDTGLIGRALVLDGEPYTVVGVLRPELRIASGAGFWAPRALTDEDRGRDRGAVLTVLGRLRPEASVRRAREEMQAIAARLSSERPYGNAGKGIAVVPLRELLLGDVEPGFAALSAGVSFLLLIAFANVASLLLARATIRQKELAVRAALGASRSRLVRLLLGETVVLALLSGLAALPLAAWSIDLIRAQAPSEIPRLDLVRLDARVFAFALGLSTLAGILVGIVPALQASRTAPGRTLQAAGSAGPRRTCVRRALVVSEIALAFALLAGSGLLVRSLVRISQLDPGFARDGSLLLQVFLWGPAYPDDGKRQAFVSETLERLEALPGVSAAGAVTSPPLIGFDMATPVVVEGRPQPRPGEATRAHWLAATPGYFPAMGLRIARGRAFDASDRSGAGPVAVVNESFARREFPGEDPVGRRIVVSFGGKTTREIVGVVADVRRDGLDREPRPEVYVPFRQQGFGHVTFVLRSRDAEALVPAAKNALWKGDPALPIYRLRTIEMLLAESLAGRRFLLLLLGAFAAASVALASVGVGGLVAYQVGERRREIGIRMALGARGRDISRLLLRHDAATAAAGLAGGLVLALALTRPLSGYLYGVAPFDPATLASSAALLGGVALLAAYLPARRAARIDPIEALRGV